MSKKKSPSITYSRAIAQQLCEQMESEKKLVATLCKENPDIYPNVRTITRWQKKYPWFDNRVSEAYTNIYLSWTAEMDEITRMSSIRFAVEVLNEPDLDHKLAQKAKEDRYKALVTLTTKLSPALLARFDKSKQPTTPVTASNVVIMTYADEQILTDENK